MFEHATLRFLRNSRTVYICGTFGSAPDSKVSLSDSLQIAALQVRFNVLQDLRDHDFRPNESQGSDSIVASLRKLLNLRTDLASF